MEPIKGFLVNETQLLIPQSLLSKISDLEHPIETDFGKFLGLISKTVLDHFSLIPRGDGFRGIDSLSNQLNNLTKQKNYSPESFDCKLPTFLCGAILKKYFNLESFMATFCDGAHPYLLVPENPNSGDKSRSLIYKLSFHPNGCSVERLKFARNFVTLAHILDEKTTQNFRMKLFPINEDGIKAIDEAIRI